MIIEERMTQTFDTIKSLEEIHQSKVLSESLELSGQIEEILQEDQTPESWSNEMTANQLFENLGIWSNVWCRIQDLQAVW